MNRRRYRIRGLMAALLALLVLLGGMPAMGEGPSADYNMPYYIEVDLTSQIVTVYETATNGIARQMLCATGIYDNTPRGNFILPANQRNDRKPWYYIKLFRRYVKYATRIRGDILFHSMPYYRKSLQAVDSEALAQLGTKSSHGCIRLRWQDAEFIALNCLPGTGVRIIDGPDTKDSLKELLRQESYDASKGFSYESFLGISTEPGALGRSSAGREVLDLQYRLRDLGLYDGELNGYYDSATVNAVKAAQYLMGEDTSGAATEAFRERLYAPDAPTAMNISLSEGMSGPAVQGLQQNLAALRLYDEPADSVYDAAVVEAVKRFQQAYCYDQDGVASPRVQKAIAYEAQRLAETFGDADYACEPVTEALVMARVSVAAGTRLRQEATSQSRMLKRLPEGALMIVVEKGREWTRVRSGSDTGYVINDCLAFGEGSISVLRYAALDSDLVCTVGNSPEDYRAGAGLPCDVFDEYLAANDQQPDVGSLVSYVKVDTHGEAASLNLREAPDGASAVLAAVPDGVSLRVKRRYADWTLASYEGVEGYLLNRYLSFWTGPDDALNAEEDAPEEGVLGTAIVQSAGDGDAEVFEWDADDARLLGHLPDGARVEVLDAVDGWCRISWQGHEGYMIAEDLSLEETQG